MKTFAYFDSPELQEQFATLYGKDYKREQDRETDELDGGIVMPPIRPKGNYHKHSYGVLDKELRYCTRSSIWEESFHEYSVPPEIPFIDKEVTYCGAIYHQYGHFLLEATTRLWHVLEHKEESPYLCFSSEQTDLPWYAREFFALLGIPEDHILIVTQYTRFRKVTVPAPSFVWWKYYTEEFLTPFKAAAADIEPAPYEHIYLSRKDTALPASIYGEQAIEAAFNANGFRSVELQFLSLREQIAIIKGAKSIAGVNGTALHNIVFSDNHPNIIILNRTGDADTQYLINAAAGVRTCSIIKAYAQPLPVIHGIGPFILGITSEMRRFFRDSHFKGVKGAFRPEKHLVRFITKYQEKYSIPENRQLLELKHKQHIDANVAAHLFLLAQSPTKMRQACAWLHYHLLWGKRRKAQKEKYRQLRNRCKLRKQALSYLWPDRQP